MAEYHEGAFSWHVQVGNGAVKEGTKVKAKPPFAKGFLNGRVQKIKNDSKVSTGGLEAMNPKVLVRFDNPLHREYEFSSDWLTTRVKKR